MAPSLRRGRASRLLAGGSVLLLGCGLLAVPVYDIWNDVANLSRDPALTLLENGVFALSAGVLVTGGVWLVRTGWETQRVVKTARRTLLATAVVAALIGTVTFLRVRVSGTLRPVMLGFDVVLVGAVSSFAVAVSSARVDGLRSTARRERAATDRLRRLYRTTTALNEATSREEAYALAEEAVEDLLYDESFRLVLDGEPAVERGDTGPTSAEPSEPSETVPLGDRGRIELLDGSLESPDAVAVELFGSHLDGALGRIDRETELREERNVLEFVNRTLRHDLIGDISLVQARLRILERNDALADDPGEEHLTVALDRVEEMNEFVTTTRTYMRSVLNDDYALEAVPLAPAVDGQVASVERAHPEAEIRNDGVPEVTVAADELLERAFANLLTDAVEGHDTSTPRVHIDGERRGDVVRVHVADDGPGISAEHHRAVFERGERSTESGGSGFGLSLVKDVVEGYGGAVRVRDNDPQGTVVELDLPVANGD